MKRSAHDTVIFRGPVRKRRALIGAPNHTPVPISLFAARVQPKTGTVARFAPSTDKALKKYNTKASNAIA